LIAGAWIRSAILGLNLQYMPVGYPPIIVPGQEFQKNCISLEDPGIGVLPLLELLPAFRTKERLCILKSLPIVLSLAKI
jgi:hypothetical protein